MTDFQRTIPTIRSLALGEAGYLAAAPALVVPANTVIQDMAQHLRESQQQDAHESLLIVLAMPGSSLPKPIGMLMAHDVAWAMLTEPDIGQKPLTALARPPVTIAAQATLDQAWDAFQHYNDQCLVLVDDNEALAGVISRRALLEALIHRQSMPPQERAVNMAGLDTDRPPSSPPTAIGNSSSEIAAVAVNGQGEGQDIATIASQGAWLSHASNDGLWEWNLTTDRLSLSPRWKEILGYQPQDLADDWSTWENLLIMDDRPTLASLRQAFQVNQADRIQLIQRFEHKNQTIVHGLVRAVRYSDPQEGDRLLGLVTDISELAQNQQELTNILDSSIDGIAALRSIRNSTGQIVDFLWTTVNTAAETVLQQSRDHLLNRQLIEQIPSVRQDGLFDAYIRVVETGQTFSRAIRLEQNGAETWLQLTAVKLGDGLTLTFRDITQARQAEQALQDTNQQLERRIDELKFRNREMALLSEMIDFLQVCITVDEAYTAVADLVQALFPGCSGAVFSLESSRVALEAVATWGNDPIGETLFYPDDCWALRRGRIHWAEHQHAGLLCRHAHPLSPPAESLCLPMMAQSETLGLLYLCTPQPDSLSGSKQQLARTVAEQVALAISNLRLRETLQQQSIRDPLTGLHNRRYLEEALEQAVCRARRDRSPIGAIILDIDHFKKFNDTFGHDAGDLVLQEVAQFLQSRIRGSDIACRYGGEEMTLILPGATLDETLQRAELMCQELRDLSLRHGGQTLGTITASFGVASFPQHAVTVATLLQAADAALYQAKWAGRDRVVMAQG